MDINADDVIEKLKQQRNAYADACAMLDALCDGLKRKVEELEKKVAELRPPVE